MDARIVAGGPGGTGTAALSWRLVDAGQVRFDPAGELSDEAPSRGPNRNRRLQKTPDPFSCPITATADDGTTIAQDVSDDLGTAYFGFYQDDPLGPPIASISVSSPGVANLVVGEFGIAIPAPAVLPLLGITGATAMSGHRRRRRR